MQIAKNEVDMTYKIAIALLFCIAPATLGAQTKLAPANLTFRNVGADVGLIPLGIGRKAIVGGVYGYGRSLTEVGFLLKPPGSIPQFMITVKSSWTSGLATGVDAQDAFVVGGYCTANDCASNVSKHGFLLELQSGLIFRQLDFPGSWTLPAAVNSSMVIVGTYCPSGSCYLQYPDHGFKYENGVFTEITFPGATSTGVFGINDAGDMVGGYFTNGSPQAWLYRSGVYTTLNPPGSVGATALGINNSGVVVGTFYDASNQLHGFTYQSGVFQQIDHPNATQTSASGINDQNEIVGTYETTTGSVGYRAK